MTLNEIIQKLLDAKRLLEADGRDCDTVCVFSQTGSEIVKIDLKDDGSGMDNLDLYLGT